ncbi:GH116 family glycosyl-hydrolase [Pseudactinotalea sp.]|uniref:GH116 family glycosyl-hydrolase n=1 Tax=Pseudactinotalea sp. TaxID=1926260 RepID=UPI003B3B172C
MPRPLDPAARVLGPHAQQAAFPLGGIGTGNVSIGSRGEFRDWEISNHPDKGSWLPNTFAAVRAQRGGDEPFAAMLEAAFRPPFEGDNGIYRGRGAGLPRLQDARLVGEYPMVEVEFRDDRMPIEISMSAFTPLVPLDVADSGIPGAVLRYHLYNPHQEAVAVTLVLSMASPIGVVGRNQAGAPRFEGTPFVRYRDSGDLRGLAFGSDLPAESFEYGTAALATAERDVTVTEEWLIGARPDGAQLFWEDLVTDGQLDRPGDHPVDPGFHDDGLRVGSLGVVLSLAPGEHRDVEYLMSWHVPNRRRAWQGTALVDTHRDERVRNQYAVRYPDAWAVAQDLSQRLPELEGATRAFRDALFGSTLPAELVDAVSATLVVLRSTTCFLLEDGSEEGLFAAWEGSLDHAGSCEGTCTHVWNYAQTAAHLFPGLERSARRTELLHETDADGRMRFRSNSVFGGEPWEFRPAVDGQMGTVVRVFREWVLSGDDGFLRELWPATRRALEFAFEHWDSDGDLVLDSEQHNTYDIEFFGPNSLANSMFLAALHAGAQMAAYLGEAEAAAAYRKAAASASARVDTMLFNGEYYDQRLADVDEHRYQYGTGCLADQLFGQTLAHLVGLGHVLPSEHVRSAVAAVHRHNFFADVGEHVSAQRTYALPGEAGMILCTWPRGGRPRLPFIYCDEVWSGVEYQVATHLVYEGMVAEGLEVVRAVRDRHDGVRRNPWNEVECGNHYARSLASWGVLLAILDHRWDGRSQVLSLGPRQESYRDGVLQAPVFTSAGWGELLIRDGRAVLACRGGQLQAAGVVVTTPDGVALRIGAIDLAPGGSVDLT